MDTGSVLLVDDVFTPDALFGDCVDGVGVPIHFFRWFFSSDEISFFIIVVTLISFHMKMISQKKKCILAFVVISSFMVFMFSFRCL